MTDRHASVSYNDCDPDDLPPGINAPAQPKQPAMAMRLMTCQPTNGALRVARETADRVVEFKDPAEAAALPGLLGRIGPALLKCNGWYAANVDGTKTLYVLGG